MSKRLLVTGYGGFVAGSVVAQAGTEWDVIGAVAFQRDRRSRGYHRHCI